MRSRPCQVAIPIRREESLSGTAQRDDLGGVGWGPGKKISPCAHQPAPLVEQVNVILSFGAQRHHVWGRVAVRHNDC